MTLKIFNEVYLVTETTDVLIIYPCLFFYTRFSKNYKKSMLHNFILFFKVPVPFFCSIEGKGTDVSSDPGGKTQER